MRRAFCHPKLILSAGRCGAGIGNTQIWGTQPDSIDEAEDRDRWMACLQRLDIKQPPGGMVTTEEGAIQTAAKLGYPVGG